MKRPTRTVRRESKVVLPGSRSKSYPDGRPLVLIIPPTCDVLMIREKGRRVAHELDIFSAWSVANKLTALKRRAERKAKRGKR